MRPARPPRSSFPLAAAYGALVVYASLYPLSGWHHPKGLWSWAFMSLPWPSYWLPFDVVANLFGYLPLGAWVFARAMHAGRSRWVAALMGVLLPSLLSLALELTQNYLPERVPSALDWVLNTGGALLGVLLAALADRAGLPLRWRALRARWFVADASSGLGLLLLWPIGLLFPAPVPLGLGQVWPHILQSLAALGDWAEGVAWAADWAPALAGLEGPDQPLTPLTEAALTGFGLLAPCLLAYTCTRPGGRRLVLAAGAAGLGFAVTTLSTALNFGPQHALAWVTPTTPAAFSGALLLAALAVGVSCRSAAALGLVAVTGLLVLAAQAPSDPYYADSLLAWEQGRFIRFHGAAQWVGWLWPFLLLTHLLRRLRMEGFPQGP